MAARWSDWPITLSVADDRSAGAIPGEVLVIELSVIIPSRDAGPRLASCLAALAAQEGADGAFEVVVVDDGSVPPVPAGLEAPADRFPLRVIRRDVPGGIAVARNTGWRIAQGRISLFLDDDIGADPGLVAGHIAAHAGPGMRIGIGRLTTRVAPDADWLAQRFADAWNAHVRALDGGRSLKAGDCYGGNLSIPTDLLRESGGFDEEFSRSEDIELAARLIERGVGLVFVLAQSEHHERKPGRAMLADAHRNGALAATLVERHPWLVAESELGSYAAFGQRQLLLRRLATLARLPAEQLARLAPALGAGPAGRSALTLLVHLAFWSGVRTSIDAETFRRLTDGTAILMYHGFAPAGTQGSRYVVPVDRFEAQLGALLRAGHRPINLSSYLDHRRSYRFPPANSFVVTIDDGYADVEELAAPVLHRLGIPATIFLVEGALGGNNDWDRTGVLAGRPILADAAIERLRAEGFEFGPHSAGQWRLAGAPAAVLDEEIRAATSRLSARVGPLVPAFAYPYGLADEAARSAVTEAGFIGLGVREGLACPVSPDAELPRIEVRGTDSPLRVVLAARLGGTRRLTRR
jgi:peptidoglycan/xylan/chitin deacetylase (PgdA/CDA1 family)